MVVFLTVLFYAQLFPETPGLSASDRLGKELFHRECQLRIRDVRPNQKPRPRPRESSRTATATSATQTESSWSGWAG